MMVPISPDSKPLIVSLYHHFLLLDNSPPPSLHIYFWMQQTSSKLVLMNPSIVPMLGLQVQCTEVTLHPSLTHNVFVCIAKGCLNPFCSGTTLEFHNELSFQSDP